MQVELRLGGLRRQLQADMRSAKVRYVLCGANGLQADMSASPVRGRLPHGAMHDGDLPEVPDGLRPAPVCVAVPQELREQVRRPAVHVAVQAPGGRWL